MGYYLDVGRPRIGGKLPLTTYSKHCPPTFGGELMNGGGKKTIKRTPDTSYIDSINMLNNMSNRITKHKLSEIISTATLDNIESINFHKYFNQPTMRVISSIAIMNLLNDGNLSNHTDRVKRISKLMKTDSSNILQLGGNSRKIYFSSLNELLNKMRSTNQIGGGERVNSAIAKIKEFIKPVYDMINGDMSF